MRIARRALAAVIVAAVVASAGFNAASALEQKPALSVEVAEKAAMACDKYARAKGWKMNIAVLDDGGGLLYFRRDPASFRGASISPSTRPGPPPNSVSRRGSLASRSSRRRTGSSTRP